MGFKLEDADGLRGATMVDREGARIGKIEDVFLDRHTGRPAWAAVKTGWFGHKHTVVPITDAVLGLNGDVLVPFTKDRVKAAPNIEPGQQLTPELEREMWEHYGISGYGEWADGTDATHGADGTDATHGAGLPDDAEDAAAQLAAPVMARLRRVTVVVVVPAAGGE